MPLNIYFLIITLLSYIKESPKDPILNTVTILFMFSFLILKEIYDGWQNLLMDRQVNENKCWVYSYGMIGFRQQKWSDVKVGDIILA